MVMIATYGFGYGLLWLDCVRLRYNFRTTDTAAACMGEGIFVVTPHHDTELSSPQNFKLTFERRRCEIIKLFELINL